MVVAVEGEQALLDDAVTTIVGDHDRERQLVMCRGPQRLDRIHRATVAGEADDWPLRIGEADADGGRHAPADATRSECMVAVAIAVRTQRQYLPPGGQSLIDKDRIVRHR